MKRLRINWCRAFTVLELLIVVTVLFVLAALVLPEWARQQRRSRNHVHCGNNLKQIGLAFKTWAIDNNDKYPMQVSVTNGGTMELVKEGNAWPHFLVMSNELSTPRVLFCAEETDARRKLANSFTASAPVRGNDLRPLTNDCSVSYFVGVDATEDRPNTLLSGDCNLVVDGQPVSHGLQSLWTNRTVVWSKSKHQGQGYILLSDGSVQMLSNQSWRSVLTATGVATNRLAMP